MLEDSLRASMLRKAGRVSYDVSFGPGRVICRCDRCNIIGPIEYDMTGFDPGDLNFFADKDSAVVCFNCQSADNVTRIDNLPGDPDVPG